MLTSDAIDKLQDIQSDMKSEITTQAMMRHTYERIDRYLQKTSDTSDETLAGEAANKRGEKKIGNVEIAITQQYKETAEAYYVGTFLTGNPIFAATSKREHERAASMLTALTARDQYRMNWVEELSRCIDDVLRYNICASEVMWETRTVNNVQTSNSPGSTTTGRIKAVSYEGNGLHRIDPYNLVHDMAVEPSKVHIDGNYAGYFEMKDYISFKRAFNKWNETYVIKRNIKQAFQSNQGQNHYYVPKIRKISDVPDQHNNWAHYWGTNTTHDMHGVQGAYEFFTLYKRIIPKEYGMTKVPGSGAPQVYKLVWVNGFLMYAEPILSGHEYLPIVIGQTHAGPKTTKGYTEYLMPLQDLATATMSAKLHSMRRAVSDRALYNPKRIRKADIEAEAPNSKIPVSGNAMDEDMRTAYFQIPFQDTVSGLFDQNLGTIFTLAENETGQNRSTQGSFIKGNKTMHEFGTIMSNSQSRMQLGAMKLGQSFFNPIKEIIKLNYLVHAQSETITGTEDQGETEIDPVELRNLAPEFKMADGIMPSTKLANTEVLMQASQLFAQNPMAFQRYDIEGMLVSIIRQQGFTDVDNYERTPEQQQQFMANMQAMQGGQGNGGSAPTGGQGGGQPPQ